MDAGKLRHRIAVAPLQRGRDAIGGVTEEAGAPFYLWAHVEPIGAQERFEGAKFTVRPDIRVLIRYRADIRHRDRVIWRDREYEIVDAPRDPDTRRRWMELLAAAKEPGAGVIGSSIDLTATSNLGMLDFSLAAQSGHVATVGL